MSAVNSLVHQFAISSALIRAAKVENFSEFEQGGDGFFPFQAVDHFGEEIGRADHVDFGVFLSKRDGIGDNQLFQFAVFDFFICVARKQWMGYQCADRCGAIVLDDPGGSEKGTTCIHDIIQ